MYKNAKTRPNFYNGPRADNKNATSLVCKKCGEEKPVSEFYFRKDNDNYRAWCKACFKPVAYSFTANRDKFKHFHAVKNKVKKLREKGISEERIQLVETLIENKELLTVDGKIVRISNLNLSTEEQGMFLQYPNGTMIRIGGPNAGKEEIDQWFKIRGMKRP